LFICLSDFIVFLIVSCYHIMVNKDECSAVPEVLRSYSPARRQSNTTSETALVRHRQFALHRSVRRAKFCERAFSVVGDVGPTAWNEVELAHCWLIFVKLLTQGWSKGAGKYGHANAGHEISGHEIAGHKSASYSLLYV